MLHSQIGNHNFSSLLLNLSTWLCCIDLEISPWSRLRKGEWYKTFIYTNREHGIIVGIKYCGDTTFKTIFIKLAVEVSAL